MLRKVDSQVLFSATNFSFAARITTEATACLAVNLNSTLVIGCRKARQRGKKKKKQTNKNVADGEEQSEFEVGQ